MMGQRSQTSGRNLPPGQTAAELASRHGPTKFDTSGFKHVLTGLPPVFPMEVCSPDCAHHSLGYFSSTVFFRTGRGR